MYVAQEWKDYEVMDTGGGEKLERWGDIVLRRPDPQIIWPLAQETAEWRNVHGHYHRSSSGGGNWDMKNLSLSAGPLAMDRLNSTLNRPALSILVFSQSKQQTGAG